MGLYCFWSRHYRTLRNFALLSPRCNVYTQSVQANQMIKNRDLGFSFVGFLFFFFPSALPKHKYNRMFQPAFAEMKHKWPTGLYSSSVSHYCSAANYIFSKEHGQPNSLLSRGSRMEVMKHPHCCSNNPFCQPGMSRNPALRCSGDIGESKNALRGCFNHLWKRPLPLFEHSE